MVPMNEMHRYLRNGLLYFYNIATEHYDSLTFLRYYTEDMIFFTEFIINGFLILRTFILKLKSTFSLNNQYSIHAL